MPGRLGDQGAGGAVRRGVVAWVFPAAAAVGAVGGLSYAVESGFADAVAGGVYGYNKLKSAIRFGRDQIRWRADDMAKKYASKPTGGKRKRTGWKKTLGKRSRMGGSGRIAKRRRFAPIAGRRYAAGGQFNRRSVVKYGRRKRPTLRQIVKQLPFVVERHQSLRPMNSVDPATAVVGKNPLAHWEATTGTGTYPLHVYDLMGMRNGTSGTMDSAYELGITNIGAPIFFSLRTNTATDGVTLATGYQADYRSQVNMITDTTGVQYIRCDWYDIRLLLYGCRSQPTVFDIMYVGFTQDEVDPLSTPSAGPLQDHRSAFWQGIVQQQVYNPVLPTQPGVLRGMKVFKRKRVVIQPELNIEYDSQPKSVAVKMFIRDGRVCDYAHEAEKLLNDNLLNDGAWVNRNDAKGDFRNHPRVRARRWLIVRAMNTTPIDTTVQTSVNTPSYDIVIRRKVSFIEGQ